MMAKDRFHSYTEDELVEAMTTWAAYPGMTGATCGKCHKTANVLNSDATGWFCSCGQENPTLFPGRQYPYENPDLGPTSATIQAAWDRAEQIKSRS